jgi:hypothetical protein
MFKPSRQINFLRLFRRSKRSSPSSVNASDVKSISDGLAPERYDQITANPEHINSLQVGISSQIRDTIDSINSKTIAEQVFKSYKLWLNDYLRSVDLNSFGVFARSNIEKIAESDDIGSLRSSIIALNRVASTISYAPLFNPVVDKIKLEFDLIVSQKLGDFQKPTIDSTVVHQVLTEFKTTNSVLFDELNAICDLENLDLEDPSSKALIMKLRDPAVTRLSATSTGVIDSVVQESLNSQAYKEKASAIDDLSKQVSNFTNNYCDDLLPCFTVLQNSAKELNSVYKLLTLTPPSTLLAHLPQTITAWNDEYSKLNAKIDSFLLNNSLVKQKKDQLQKWLNDCEAIGLDLSTGQALAIKSALDSFNIGRYKVFPDLDISAPTTLATSTIKEFSDNLSSINTTALQDEITDCKNKIKINLGASTLLHRLNFNTLPSTLPVDEREKKAFLQTQSSIDSFADEKLISKANSYAAQVLQEQSRGILSKIWGATAGKAWNYTKKLWGTKEDRSTVSFNDCVKSLLSLDPSFSKFNDINQNHTYLDLRSILRSKSVTEIELKSFTFAIKNIFKGLNNAAGEEIKFSAQDGFQVSCLITNLERIIREDKSQEFKDSINSIVSSGTAPKSRIDAIVETYKTQQTMKQMEDQFLKAPSNGENPLQKDLNSIETIYGQERYNRLFDALQKAEDAYKAANPDYTDRSIVLQLVSKPIDFYRRYAWVEEYLKKEDPVAYQIYIRSKRDRFSYWRQSHMPFYGVTTPFTALKNWWQKSAESWPTKFASWSWKTTSSLGLALGGRLKSAFVK